jgi:hypothetical protein
MQLPHEWERDTRQKREARIEQNDEEDEDLIEQEEQVPEDPQEREARNRQDDQDIKDLIGQDDEQQEMIEQEPECSSTIRFPVCGSREAEEDSNSDCFSRSHPMNASRMQKWVCCVGVVDSDLDSDKDVVLDCRNKCPTILSR